MTNNEKTILCFGDSNTWGYVPGTGDRFQRSERWGGILQHNLGQGFQVVEEGLNNRTTTCDDPIQEHRNGREYLIPCLLSHRPIDLFVMMLGTNSAKSRHSLSAYDISLSIEELVMLARSAEYGRGRPPRVIVVSPPAVGSLSEFAEVFAGAAEKIRKLAPMLEDASRRLGCEFIDAAKFTAPSLEDGIHIDATSHRSLGEAIATLVGRMFGSSLP